MVTGLIEDLKMASLAMQWKLGGSVLSEVCILWEVETLLNMQIGSVHVLFGNCASSQ